MTSTATAPRFVKAITCSKCTGTGAYRDVRACSKCGGEGMVEGDRATVVATKARNDARRALRLWATDAAEAAGMHRVKACDLTYALDHLEANAPERYTMATISFVNNHPALLAGIVVYAAEQGFLRHGTRRLDATAALALIGA